MHAVDEEAASLSNENGTPEKQPVENHLKPAGHPEQETAEISMSNFAICSPEIILPVPKVEKRNNRKSSNRRGKTVVLTESPYKNELLEENKKSRPTTPKGVSKRKLFQKGRPTKPTKKPKQDCNQKKKMNSLLDVSKPSCSKKPKVNLTEVENDDEECLYCYDFSEEGWIRCSMCARWAHNSCAGIEDEDDDAIHICVLCSSGH